MSAGVAMVDRRPARGPEFGRGDISGASFSGNVGDWTNEEGKAIRRAAK